MDSQDLTAIIVPIVAFVGLGFLIMLVMHANKHPTYRAQAGKQRPRRTTAGGSFRATGGRQVTPDPEQDVSALTAGQQSPEDSARSQ